MFVDEIYIGCKTCNKGPVPCCLTCSNHGDCPHENTDVFIDEMEVNNA